MSELNRPTPTEEKSIEECGKELKELGEELLDTGRTRALYILRYELGLVAQRLDEFDEFA